MVNLVRKYWYLLAVFSLVLILSACRAAPQETETVNILETSASQETETVYIPETFAPLETEPANNPETTPAVASETAVGIATALTCEPTAADMLGPFYEADAPVRNSVGKGYVLSGVIRVADRCSPVPGAVIEFWLAGPDGAYADEYRATVIADENGAYRFESHPPPPYSGRPSHIHIRVTAPDYQELVTQHYPKSGQSAAAFDLVIQP